MNAQELEEEKERMKDVIIITCPLCNGTCNGENKDGTCKQCGGIGLVREDKQQAYK